MEFPISANCDTSRISANFEGGILSVRMPKLIVPADEEDNKTPPQPPQPPETTPTNDPPPAQKIDQEYKTTTADEQSKPTSTNKDANLQDPAQTKEAKSTEEKGKAAARMSTSDKHEKTAAKADARQQGNKGTDENSIANADLKGSPAAKPQPQETTPMNDPPPAQKIDQEQKTTTADEQSKPTSTNKDANLQELAQEKEAKSTEDKEKAVAKTLMSDKRERTAAEVDAHQQGNKGTYDNGVAKADLKGSPTTKPKPQETTPMNEPPPAQKIDQEQKTTTADEQSKLTSTNKDANLQELAQEKEAKSTEEKEEAAARTSTSDQRERTTAEADARQQGNKGTYGNGIAKAGLKGSPAAKLRTARQTVIMILAVVFAFGLGMYISRMGWFSGKAEK